MTSSEEQQRPQRSAARSCTLTRTRIKRAMCNNSEVVSDHEHCRILQGRAASASDHWKGGASAHVVGICAV
jgi:hypothetical protein